jgi:hypothetical protein
MEGCQMETQLKAARIVCAWLFVLDIALGAGALFAPRTFMRLFAPGGRIEDYALVRRTGALWLFFAPVQAWAVARASDPRALRAVAVLRLQEVPADSVWLLTGRGFGWFGRSGIASAPLFNLATGAFLLGLARRLDAARGRVE